MPVNPDASQRLSISFREPRVGSCLTPELLSELASLIEVTLPPGGTADAPCISADSNNIAQLDPQNCLLVPSAVLYVEEQTWDASSPTDLTFDGFASQQIDATACLFACNIFLDSAEAGTVVLASPSGTASVRPVYEIKELSASKIVITVKHAASDVRVRIQLLQLPVPPEST